jgi:pyruvate kinase
MQNLYVTLGLSSFDREVVKKLSDAGATLFRINLSHTNIENLEKVIKSLQGLKV